MSGYGATLLAPSSLAAGFPTNSTQMSLDRLPNCSLDYLSLHAQMDDPPLQSHPEGSDVFEVSGLTDWV